MQTAVSEKPSAAARYPASRTNDDARPTISATPAAVREFSWSAFRAFLEKEYTGPAPSRHNVLCCSPVRFENNVLTLEIGSVTQKASLEREANLLEQALSEYRRCSTRVLITLTAEAARQAQTVSAEGMPPVNRPELKYCFEILNAQVLSIVPKNAPTLNKQ